MVAARGYPIGNHTAQHTHLAGKSIVVQQAAIAAGRTWLRQLIGRAPIPIVRPPTGTWDANTVKAAARAGARMLLTWDTHFGDTSLHDDEARTIRLATLGRNGSVILLHCRTISADVLERVIDDYLARGFEFVTVPQLFGLKGPVPTYPADPPPPGPSLRRSIPSWLAHAEWLATMATRRG
jgi:peptidoglycan/xylan/chitin deacetylase (PgdA/CDA1 family)